jgi:hypothetical protein
MILHIPRAKFQPLGDCHVNVKWLQNYGCTSQQKHESRKMDYTIGLVKKQHHVKRTCHDQNDQGFAENQEVDLAFDLWILENHLQLK